MVYLPTWMVVFHGKSVGKYTVPYMDPMFFVNDMSLDVFWIQYLMVPPEV